MINYNPSKIEPKWQKYWEESGLFKAVDFSKSRKKFYHLVMFPYPSGDLHIGHWYNFAPGDIYARFKYLQGYNVLSPIGFDAFGLPAENAAIKYKMHPKEWIDKNIAFMRGQLRSTGAMYDWSREINTSNPDYYKWTQWLFLQLYKAGLVYRKKVLANWCPKDQTVLANEQVIDGRCERHPEVEVVQKEVEQWLFKITKYAERLLKDLEKLDWPQNTKLMQKNWIGKSEGAIIKFPIFNSQFFPPQRDPAMAVAIDVFTTRPDTLYGATYLVLAPEHSLVTQLKTGAQAKKVQKYIEQTQKKTELERTDLAKEKTGVPLGTYAINPFNNQKIPIWISDYVLSHYGTGAIMAVPAHDQRDFEFAKKFKLPIKPVIVRTLEELELSSARKTLKQAYEGHGFMFQSGKFSGLSSEEGKRKVVQFLKEKKLGEPKVEYHLHDWIISRQRYWGVPIPIVYCEQCGIQPVHEKELPIMLPKVDNFKPKGQSPLTTNPNFLHTTCPNCQGKALRETDTLDTFVDSSWYFIRYLDPKNQKTFADQKLMQYWLPPDIYIGGAEHTVMHLLYARFFIKALYDLRLVPFNEPFPKLRHQGTILGPDRQKMSKSRGNVVDPDDLVAKYGSDAVRMFLAFMGPYDEGGPWNNRGILGTVRYLNRVFQSKERVGKATSVSLVKNLHQTIRKVTADIEALRFNTAVANLMEFQNSLEKANYQISKSDFIIYLTILTPFAPHLSEEIYAQLGGKISIMKNSWPKADPRFLQEKEKLIVIQLNGKVKDRITVGFDLSEDEIKKIVLDLPKVKTIIKKKSIKKVVYVKDKLINLVI